MSYMRQNLRLFPVSTLSVLNFRVFLLMYPGSVTHCAFAEVVDSAEQLGGLSDAGGDVGGPSILQPRQLAAAADMLRGSGNHRLSHAR